MKVYKRMALGLVFIVFMVGFFGYITLRNTRNTLQSSIVEKTVLLAGDILNKVERRIHSRIENQQVLTKDAVIQGFLQNSNREYETRGNIQEYIDEQDKL